MEEKLLSKRVQIHLNINFALSQNAATNSHISLYKQIDIKVLDNKAAYFLKLTNKSLN